MKQEISNLKRVLLEMEYELESFEGMAGNRNDELTIEYMIDEIEEVKERLEILKGEYNYNKHIDDMNKMARDTQRWAIEDRAREIEIIGY